MKVIDTSTWEYLSCADIKKGDQKGKKGREKGVKHTKGRYIAVGNPIIRTPQNKELQQNFVVLQQ